MLFRSNDTATTEIYTEENTLSLHDALPIFQVTDHRINLTLYKLDDVMNGNLDELIGALNQEHQAEELAQQVE